MKERPILFQGPLVRAILEDRKTQTRRTLNPQPTDDTTGSGSWFWKKQAICSHRWPEGLISPYGVPGDHLWVREAWQPVHDDFSIRYTADGETRYAGAAQANWFADDYKKEKMRERGRPSIHMPRWASRLTLAIEEVRVQRLQDITEEDAKAEGAELKILKTDLTPEEIALIDWPLWEPEKPYKSYFSLLWESINGFGSWKDNPWVWAITFKRLAG